MRVQAYQHITQLETIAANQETQLQEFAQQLQILQQAKSTLEIEREEIKKLLDEELRKIKSYDLSQPINFYVNSISSNGSFSLEILVNTEATSLWSKFITTYL